MFSDIFNNEIILSVDGKKITENVEDINDVSSQLPLEPAALLKAQLNNSTILQNSFKNQQTVKTSGVKVSETLPDEPDSDFQKVVAECLKLTNPPKERKISPYFSEEELENLEKKTPSPPPPPPPSPQGNTINEFGSALNIALGISTKLQVVSLMKKHSKIVFEHFDLNNIFNYSDISLRVIFNFKNIVQELQFGRNYPGGTRKGLLIGDTLERAMEIYGQPRIKSLQTAIWLNFAVFLESNIVTGIRIFH